jgi:hypothetical protein
MVIFIIGNDLSSPHLLKMFKKSKLAEKIERVFESTSKNESPSDCKETFHEQKMKFDENSKEYQLFFLSSFFSMVDLVILEISNQLTKVESKAELKNVFEDYSPESWKLLFHYFCQWISIETFSFVVGNTFINDSKPFQICMISGESQEVESKCLKL